MQSSMRPFDGAEGAFRTHPTRSTLPARRKITTLEFCARIRSLDSVPYVRVSREELLDIHCDPTTAFVLSCVDGQTNVDTLLDLCPTSLDRTLRILATLVEANVVGLYDEGLREADQGAP